MPGGARSLLTAAKIVVWLLLCAFPVALLVVLLPGGWVLAVIIAAVVAGERLYRRHRGPTPTPGTSAMGFALMANGIAVALTMLSFLSAPPGSSGRPMALVFFYLVFGFLMTMIGVGKAVRAWSHEKPLALSALVLSLGLLPVEFLTLFALVTAKAFELEP